jgi:uncharacterized cupredoxin-like copper-binding protein
MVINFINWRIIVLNGKTTMLILKNKGKKEHSFILENLRNNAEVQLGKEKTLP